MKIKLHIIYVNLLLQFFLKTVEENIILIDAVSSSLSDRYITNLTPGSIVLENIDLVGWVIIKKELRLENITY